MIYAVSGFVAGAISMIAFLHFIGRWIRSKSPKTPNELDKVTALLKMAQKRFGQIATMQSVGEAKRIANAALKEFQDAGL